MLNGSAVARVHEASDDRVDMFDLAAPSNDRRIGVVRHDAGSVTIRWDDGRQARFHAIWLRDNCPCPTCRHPKTMEREFLFIDGPEPSIAHAETTQAGDLVVHFAAAGTSSTPHVSAFHAGWLRDHCYSAWARAERAGGAKLWDSSAAKVVPTIEYQAVMETDGGLAEWLTTMRDHGLMLLRNVPAVPGQSLRVAERVGPVRPSNFGIIYDVVSMPNPNASAYTAMALEPHTDLANWRWPPDYQLLFCVENEAEGGESILVDGFRVAEELRATDREAFDTLAAQPIAFRFHDESCDIRHRAPTIQLDGDGNLVAVRFNNWLRAVLDVPEDAVEPTYRALRLFWQYLRDPRFRIRLRLRAGDLLTFDNARVLHGREAFNPNSGRRHLQGCYLDRDVVLSRLRLLERQ